jgi:hypothetical protein
MTDEPFERGVFREQQQERLEDLRRKVQDLHVMLYMVTPESPLFSRLAEVDRCEHVVVDSSGDGLSEVDFRELLGYVGRSVSASRHQGGQQERPCRALFGQDRWTRIDIWNPREG